MSITESQRCDMYVALEAVHGPEVANNIMSSLPRQPADQLVTRQDLFAAIAEVKGEVAELRAELKNDFADLKVTFQRWLSGAVAANTLAVVTAIAA